METVEDQSKTCRICNVTTGKYVCPRCNVVYCSLICYRANVHLQCSESFYKECIEEELKARNGDPKSQKEMLDILKRVENEEDDESLDSDDEEMAPELEERLAGISLDDADAVWDVLTEEERKEFVDLLQKGDVSQIVPNWTPWWKYREEKKLIEEITSSSTRDETFMQNCPKLLDNIPSFDEICKSPAACVQFNLINILYAYAYVTQYFAGDHHSFAMEAVHGLVILSCNIRSGCNYDSAEAAIESASSEVTNCQWLSGSKDLKNLIKADVKEILEGPNDTHRSFYIMSALSDIYNLILKAKNEAGKDIGGKSAFSKKFSDKSVFSLPALPKAQLRTILKKIEFYLSWSKKYAADVFCVT
ncbi:zinc finger HIT domain-containing protein 2 isoform X2 [Ischnura elegans]|uniref:zinc finger HIT domain-containing protein 2 isoform X2 n=1 Tax=Ischnura elegans TaxID=197161 RepID=UPI001ED88ACF|nr:zinc finger HIT domain-containing protein 2 isoform X2 [Ischnura elegans]